MEGGYDDATAAALSGARDALQERSTLMRRYFRENPVQEIDEASDAKSVRHGRVVKTASV